MGRYQQDAGQLLKLIGGKENIAAVSHCVTRMRFVLNDPKKADIPGIEAMKVTKGAFTQAGQFQVIIGNTVADFYPDSILHYYKRLIQLRKEEPVIAEGQIEFLFQNVPGVFAYRRFLGERELFVVNNLTGYELTLSGAPWDGYEKLPGNYGGNSSALRPYEAAVYKP